MAQDGLYKEGYKGSRKRRASAGDIDAGMDAFAKAYGITSQVMKDFKEAKVDREVSGAMKEQTTESISGDYEKSMGLTGASQQSAMLREQDSDFGTAGAQMTADALNTNRGDPTPASTQGLSTRYKLYGTESDKPFTKAQTTAMRTEREAEIRERGGQGEAARGLRAGARKIELEDAGEARLVSAEERAKLAAERDATAARELTRVRDRTEGEAVKTDTENDNLKGFEADAVAMTTEAKVTGNRQPSWDDYINLARKHNLTNAQILKVNDSMMKLEQGTSQFKLMELTSIIVDADRKGGLVGMVDAYNANPRFNNGFNIVIRSEKGDKLTLLNNGKPMHDKPITETAARTYLHGQLLSAEKGLAVLMSVTEYEGKAKLNEAQIEGLKAKAWSDRNPQAGVGGTRLTIAEANLYKSQAAAKRKQAENEPNDKVRALLLGEADMLDDQATQMYRPAPAASKEKLKPELRAAIMEADGWSKTPSAMRNDVITKTGEDPIHWPEYRAWYDKFTGGKPVGDTSAKGLDTSTPLTLQQRSKQKQEAVRSVVWPRTTNIPED